jgi:hypothetical protein
VKSFLVAGHGEAALILIVAVTINNPVNNKKFTNKQQLQNVR